MLILLLVLLHALPSTPSETPLKPAPGGAGDAATLDLSFDEDETFGMWVAALRGLQQVVASGARRLQQPGFGQRAPSGPQPAPRSMVDKMVSVIGVWETSHLASAFFVWSRRV